jgi:hypothetical protein
MKEIVKMILLFTSFFPIAAKAQQASVITFREGLFRSANRWSTLTLPAAPRIFLRPDFAWRLSGTVCKKEWRLEQKTGLPFRFRLGSVAYCDWLEAKPNARYHP